jgi:G3E family GTPase
VLKKTRLSVTILTGFLGAGKTTVLNSLLSQQQGKRFAIIENEVGQVGVDQSLLGDRLERSSTEVILMPNGCLCCRVRGDLVDALKRIVKANQDLDGVIIECSGNILALIHA